MTSDRALYKLILISISIAMIPLFMAGYLHAGLKGLIFCGWIFIAFLIFLFVAALAIDKGTEPSHGGYLQSYANMWWSINSYKMLLFVIFLILLITSIFLWNYLGTLQFLQPNENVVKSSMPAAKR